MHKRYEPALQVYDDQGKVSFRTWLSQMGCTNVLENTQERNGDYSEVYDLSAERNGCVWKFDVNVKTRWNNWFNYETFDIAERKRKATAHYQVIMNCRCDRFWIVPQWIVLFSPLVTKDCYNVDFSESFFRIPKTDGLFYIHAGYWIEVPEL